MTYTHGQLATRARQRADAEWAQKVRRAEQAVGDAQRYVADVVLAAVLEHRVGDLPADLLYEVTELKSKLAELHALHRAMMEGNG